MRERRAQGFLQLPGVLHVAAKNSASIRELREVWIDKIRAEADHSNRLHFQFHETERVVLIDDDLYRRLELPQAQQFPHKHSQSAVAGKRDHLPAGKSYLRTDRLWQGIGHGAVVKGTEQAALAVHGQVSCSPD